MIKTYQKHNSFVEIRQNKPLPDIIARIRNLYEGLDAQSLSGDRGEIIRKACDEILNKPADCGGFAPFTLHDNVIEEIGRIADNELPRYLFYRYRYETYPERKILDNFPPCLQIEPTSICNYRCVFCYQTDQEFTRKANGHMGKMSLDTFKRIIDEAEGNCEAITLASRGEPLICPDIDKMLAYAKGKFLALKMNTNAWFLDEAKAHAILEADISTLVFSADAAEEPAYSRLRVGGSLDRVLKNIALFNEVQTKYYPHSRLITRVSGVKVPGSSSLDTMEDFWGNLVDQVAFVNYNPWENAYDQPANEISTPCSDLWRRMFVWWDGTVNPCDVDYKSTLAIGKDSTGGLAHLWRSESYENLRKNHLTKQRSNCFPCNRCTVV